MHSIKFRTHNKVYNTALNGALKRSSIYWLSQISGWSVYFLVNMAAIAFTDVLTLGRALLLLMLCTLGVLLTHLYRNEVKKNDWLSFPLKKIIPRILAASLVIGTLMYAPYFSLNYTMNIFPIEGNGIAKFFIGILNMSFMAFIWSLLYFSIHLFENYKRAEIESYIWEAAVKDFELKTLKSQLNPHFMFNAMNSIRALIEEDPENAKTALTRLSNILRYSLKIERNETVPLEEEMQTVKDYLLLEGIRFEERLKYKLNIDPKTAKIEIPPMMIQTLVENAIKHGISKIPAGGLVTVDTMVNDSKLFIKITNTGHLNNEDLKSSHGFGVSNTRHRLNLIYGEKSSFNLFNENSGTVSAEIVIPTGGTNK